MATSPLLFAYSYQPASSRWSAIFQAWFPALLFSCVFAVESTARFGADHTSAPLHSLFQLIYGSVNDQDWSYTHHILRKTGHFIGYGTFSLICFRAFWLSVRKSAVSLRNSLASQSVAHALAVAATMLVASADEIHQAFLPNRTGTFSDVLLDTGGALALQFTLFLVLRTFAHWPRHSSKESRLNSTRRMPLAA